VALRSPPFSRRRSVRRGHRHHCEAEDREVAAAYFFFRRFVFFAPFFAADFVFDFLFFAMLPS
jgi:hypothetical protein